MFVVGILLNDILLPYVVAVVMWQCYFCFEATNDVSHSFEVVHGNNISINTNNNANGSFIQKNDNNHNNVKHITSISYIHNDSNNNNIASRNNSATDNTDDSRIRHIHYQSDHDQSEVSNESKSNDGRNIVARKKPVVYVETIFKTDYRPTKDKQIVNLSDLRNKKIRNESGNNSIEIVIDSMTSRSSTYRLFKKHVQFFTPFPLVVSNSDKDQKTNMQSSENRNIQFNKFDDTGWEQRMIEWEAKLAGLTTERSNHTETGPLNLYRYHYNHFFWHPSKTTTFWLLVISGILLSFLIIGLAAILYLCHRDHGSPKMELTEQEDDDDDDESNQHNQWNDVERNSLVMELSATSKTKLIPESDESSKLQESPSNPKEASETSFDLRHSCQAQLKNSIFTKEEAVECSRFGINSADQISGKSLVECNYYWSND